MRITATQELADQNLAILEGSLAQTSPLNDKAFLRVLAVVLGLAHTGIYKYSADRIRQVLVLTADLEGLKLIGEPLGIFYKPAERTVLSVTVPATTGVTVPITTSFIGDANSVLYAVNAAAVGVDGSATLEITADTVGVLGNLQAGDTLTIVSSVAGVASTATVVAVVNTGTDDEDVEAYRARVQFRMRTTLGAGNGSDYRTWAEAVGGVTRAFPYGGRPVAEGTSYPGDRTVYVQADVDINADGVPPQGLLDEVKAALIKDPVTGKTRPTLGLTSSTLFVEPITRTVITTVITNLATPAGAEADVQTQITNALTAFYAQFAPYVDGVDAVQDRRDKITNTAVSSLVQEVLDATGSSVESVAFKIGGVTYTGYELSAGELVKAGAVTYAVA